MRFFLTMVFILLITMASTGCIFSPSHETATIEGDYFVTSINYNGIQNDYTDGSIVMTFNEEGEYYRYVLDDDSWSIVDSGTFVTDNNQLTTNNGSGDIDYFTFIVNNNSVILEIIDDETIYITTLEKIQGANPVSLT